MTIPDEAIEAAAREYHHTRRGNTVPWEKLARTTRDYYRRQARIHLRAAAPIIAAHALRTEAPLMHDHHDAAWLESRADELDPTSDGDG